MAKVRDLTLKPRLENIREKRPNKVIVFSLEEIKNHFEENMEHIAQQYEVAQMLIDEGKIEDGENIWRSQIIFLVSALDFYLHEITKHGLLMIFETEWQRTEKYDNLEVRMPFLEEAIKNSDDKSWFNNYVNAKFSQVSMMSYDVIKNQLSLLGIDIKDVANRAFYCQDAEEKTMDKLRRKIGELYNRRNLIAHQFDRKSHNAEREQITQTTVEAFVEDIKKIVESIHSVALEK